MAANSLQEQLDELLPVLRRTGSDSQYVEVKNASDGFPQSILPSISAFANGSGGLVILGLNEPEFEPTGVDAEALARVLADRCSSNLEPAMRLEIEVCQVEGQDVLCAEVPELDASVKPCSVKTKGDRHRAYIRSHDGDRELTGYEHHAIQSAKSQPSEDLQPVPGVGAVDLDIELVDGLLKRIRSTRGDVFRDLDDSECLRMLGVFVKASAMPRGSDLRPEDDPPDGVSLAGLLALGRYPQQFFPRLNITFVAYATTTGEALQDGTRYLDSLPIEGSIPNMIQGAADALQRNMSRRGVVTGLLRDDLWEYPMDAVREVVVNALLHRDYHPMVQGQSVRLELYPDRLVVSNPGGIYGAIDPADLMVAPVSASRNARLARLLHDVPMPHSGRSVCENIGRGLFVTAQTMRNAGMTPPDIRHSLTSFEVTFGAESVLDEESVSWLSELDHAPGVSPPSGSQQLALAFARRHGSIDNRGYRALTGADSLTATRELADLRDRGLFVRTGERRWATWSLAPEIAEQVSELEATVVTDPVEATPETARTRWAVEPRLAAVVEAVGDGALSTRELAERFDVTQNAVRNWLRALEERGQVRPTEAGRRSRFQRWELVAEEPAG